MINFIAVNNLEFFTYPYPGIPSSTAENKAVIRSIAAQTLLVCSWRSMKDTCLMLVELACRLPLEGEESNLPNRLYVLSVQQLSSIGDHFLDLLKTLMHRGVFEQIFGAFKTFANRLFRSSNPKLRELPEKWLQDASDESNFVGKCVTRRSGGLPFIFQVSLSARCGICTKMYSKLSLGFCVGSTVHSLQ